MIKGLISLKSINKLILLTFIDSYEISINVSVKTKDIKY